MAAGRGSAPFERQASGEATGGRARGGGARRRAGRGRGSILATYARRSLAMNRVRTAVTVVGVALACALFLAVGISALSAYRYLVDVARVSSGAYNGGATGVDAAFVAHAGEEPGVGQTAWLSDEGYARTATANTLTPYLHVAGMPSGEQGAQALTYLTSLRLTQGRMPQSAGEVILPQTIVDTGAVQAQVGEQITLEVGERRSDGDGSALGWADQACQQAGGEAGLAEGLTNVSERTFTVVGLYADNAALFYVAGMAGSYVAGYPAITVADPAAERAVAQAAREAGDAGAVEGAGAASEAGGAGGTGAAGAAGTSATGAAESVAAPSFQLWLTVSDPSATIEVLARIANAADGDAAGAQPAGSDAVDEGVDTALPYAGPLLYENANLNRVVSFSLDRGIYVTIVEFAALVCTIVVVASALLIRNAFAISVTQRTRQFGLLSSAGATARQLRGLVLREALTIDVIAIPLGLLMGYLGSVVVLTAAREAIMGGLSSGVEGVAFSVVLSPALVLIAVVLALVTTLLSAWGPARRAARMTAVDAIRSSRDVRVPAGVHAGGRVMGRLFGVSGLLAARSFRRDARPRRAVTVSLVTAVTLVVSAALLGAYSRGLLGAVVPDASGTFGRGYDLSYTFTERNVDADDADLTPQAIAERLIAADGVDEGAYALTLAASGTQLRVGEGATPAEAFDPAYLGYLGGLADGATGTMSATGATVQFVDDATYRSWLEGQGLSVDELMDPEHPRAVAVNAVRVNDGARYQTSAPFAREEFPAAVTLEANEDLLGARGAGELGDAESEAGASLDVGAVAPGADGAGDAASAELGASAGSGADADAQSGADADTPDVELAFEVGACVDEAPWWVGTPECPVFLLPLSAAQTVAPQVADPETGELFFARAWSVWFRASDDARAQTAITGVLQDVGLSPARLENRAARLQSQVASSAMAQVFLWAFAAIVTLIALAGAFNAMYTSVTLRRRELAMLRSCGLTRRGVRRELLCECLLHTGRVALWAIPLAALVSAGLWASLGRTVAGASYVLPWSVVPALAVVLLVMLAAGLLALRSSRDDDLVQILRTEAI